MTVHWFRPPDAYAERSVRSPLPGLTHGDAQIVRLRPSVEPAEVLPRAACTDGETAPAVLPARRSPETDLLFWSVHIPAGALGLFLLLLTAFGCFALAIISFSGGTP